MCAGSQLTRQLLAGLAWSAARRLLLFPRGNNKQSSMVSVYLDAPEASFTPLSMSPKASFKLGLINHLDPAKSYSKGDRLC